MSPPDGRPTATDTGYGSRPGDGPGWKTNPGALLHFTTGAGPKSAEAGAGFRVLWYCGPCTRRRWLFSSADRDSVSQCLSVVEGEALRGSRWVRAKCTFRPTARASATFRM